MDSNSSDNTLELAKQFDLGIINAPRGKLTAIDLGIEQAQGNIIVAVDGDSRYGCNFLNLILTPFQESEIVGVTGLGVYNKVPLMAILGDIGNYLRPRMMGRGCAYRKEAYYQTGGFDLSIDQLDNHSMVLEEEIGLFDRLSQVGKIIIEKQAGVTTEPRRLACYLGDQSDYCKKIGKERF